MVMESGNPGTANGSFVSSTWSPCFHIAYSNAKEQAPEVKKETWGILNLLQTFVTHGTITSPMMQTG